MTSNPALPLTSGVTAHLKLDAQGRLDEDISCRKCGYNLRGLSPDGRCPECGTAVGRSLQGDYLHFADPQWVQTLASGMNWLVASILLGIIVHGIAIGLSSAGRSASLLLGIVQLGISFVGLIGYWKLTTPDPVDPRNATGITARKLTRITQLASLLLAGIDLVVPAPFTGQLAILAVLASIVGLVGMFAVLTYARQLALRIPDEKMAGTCRIIMWGFAGTLTVSLVFILAMAVLGPAVAPVYCVPSLGYLVFGIWSLLLVLRFHTAFRDAARLAAATWAAGLPPR